MALRDDYLTRLGLPVERPTLPYLDRLINAHQRRVPFETYTKIIDYDRQAENGGFLPTVTAHVERMCRAGAGGTCWALTRSFQWLLSELGFEAQLLYMDPGHLCVRVDIDGRPYYADVAYGAPLFRAYPLLASFRVDAPSETFDYRVVGDLITVVRDPGPTKVLSTTPRRFEEFTTHIADANRWEASKFLQILMISKFVGGGFVRLIGNELREYRTGVEPSYRVVRDDVLPSVLTKTFGIDPDLYRQAKEIQARHMVAAPA